MVNFRRSKKIGPFRITATKSGLGVSAGAGPLRISRSPKGRYSRTVRVPGTGIYDTKQIGAGKGRRRPAASSRSASSATSGPSRQGAVGSPGSTPSSTSSSSDTGCGCAMLVALAIGFFFLLGQCGGGDESDPTPAPATSSSTTSWPTYTRPSPQSDFPANTSAPPSVPTSESWGPTEDDAPDRENDDSRPAPFVAPVPEPTPYVPAPAAPPVATSFSSCAEARAAGAAPLYLGQPGYSPKLDRDGDGVACE